MARIWNDWAWRPDGATLEALRRGLAKLRDLRFRRETQLFDFGRPARRRQRPTSKREQARQQSEREAITRYYTKRSENTITVLKIVERANERLADNERRRARREESDVSWATVLILEGAKTRVWRRYASLTLAVRATNHEPEFADAPDHLVVHAGTVMGSLTDEELRALAKEARLKASDPRPQQLLDLKAYLSKFGQEFDALSPKAEAAAREEDERFRAQRNGGRVPKSTPPDEAPRGKQQHTAEKETDVKKTTKGKKGKPAARAAKSRKANGDGLGKEGTITRFLCEGIVAKEDDAKLLAAARKKFPKNKVRDYYVSWYRARLKKAGIFKGA